MINNKKDQPKKENKKTIYINLVSEKERGFKLIKFIDYQEVTEKSQEDYYKRKSDADKIFTGLLEADRYKKGVRLRDLVMDNE